MGCKAGWCKTTTPKGIFIVTPSLEWLPTKAKEAPSPHEVVGLNTAPVSSKEFLDIQATKKCRFTLKCIHDMITYSQMHCTDEYWQHSSITWSFWLNGCVFIYELSGCGFKSHCCHLKHNLVAIIPDTMQAPQKYQHK